MVLRLLTCGLLDDYDTNCLADADFADLQFLYLARQLSMASTAPLIPGMFAWWLRTTTFVGCRSGVIWRYVTLMQGINLAARKGLVRS